MNQKYYLLLLLVHIIAIQARRDSFDYLDFFEYCRALDYPVEDHVIPTEDHYNLRFYRIQAKNTKITSGKRVVYMQHGLVDSSDTWIINEQHLAPGLILANQGFDVWIGNSRGNRYSNHKMSKIPLDFWDFSFHDMAVYDLPAAFLYITSVTNRKIHYIGHSQGTLIMFIALSSQLKIVSDNLLSFHAYGPVAYLKHQKSAFLGNAAKTNLPGILNKAHLKWAMLFDKDGLKLNSNICRVSPLICIQMLKSISQTNVSVNNLKRLPVLFAHFPSGSSTKNFMHFEQFVKKAQFKQFDYGQRNNLKIYGQKTPPLYNLSKITFPVHLYVGKYDKLADPEDSQQLFNQLINSAGKTMKLYDFGHATFVWGKSTVHVQDALSRINAIEP